MEVRIEWLCGKVTVTFVSNTIVLPCFRHREILDREVLVFMKHSQDDRVRLYLRQALKDMALGKLSRRDVVLSALFDSMLPPVV